MVNIIRRSWLPSWIAATLVLVACAESDPVPTTTVLTMPTVPVAPAVEKPAEAPVIPAGLLSSGEAGTSHGPYLGLQSLEENILNADVIARVTLLSTATGTAQIAFARSTFWLSLLEFRFTVNEYLKGSGGSTISGVVYLGNATEAQAQVAATRMHGVHDSRWDNREGIVFLQSNDPWIEQGSYRLGAGKYWFGRMFRASMDAGVTDAYTLASIFSKLWLPEDESTDGGQGAVQGQVSTEKTFLLDVPAEAQVSGASSSTTAPPDPPSASEITLSSLKSKITAIEAEANAGGTDAYYECVRRSYLIENRVRYYLLRSGSPMLHLTSDIGSGLPEGTFVVNFEYNEAPSRAAAAGLAWFEGTHEELLRFENTDFRAKGPGMLAFTHSIVTARPLPADVYRFYPNGTWHGGLVCGRQPENTRHIRPLDVTVTAPAGVLHEAFFDPVSIGSAVGADKLQRRPRAPQTSRSTGRPRPSPA